MMNNCICISEVVLFCDISNSLFNILFCFKAEIQFHFPFFQCVHQPYPMVEVLMFPASGVGLEADGC